MNRFLSLSVMGALALSAFPALAQDASSSVSSESSVSSSSASSTSSSAASSATSWAKKANLGQAIKNKCHKLNGKSRVLCMDEVKLTDRKLPPKMRVKKSVKKAIGKNCHDYTKGSAEFKACVGEQKEITKEQNPKAAKMIKKMHDNKKGTGSSSSES